MSYKQLPIYRNYNKQLHKMNTCSISKNIPLERGNNTRNQIPQDMRTYWTFKDDMAVIDEVILKSRHTVIPEALQRQALEQHHFNDIGFEKTKILVSESFYLPGINNDIENHIEMFSMS